MGNCLSFLDVLDIAALNPNARIAVVELCCDSLRDHARLSSKDLDAAIAKLHMSHQHEIVLGSMPRDVSPCMYSTCTVSIVSIIMCCIPLTGLTWMILNMHNEYLEVTLADKSYWPA